MEIMEMALLIIFSIVLVLDIISNFFFCSNCKAKKDITEAQNEILKEIMKNWLDNIDGQDEMGWIPLKEKLPPDGQKVLLSCKYMTSEYVTVGTMEKGNRGKSYIVDEEIFLRSAIVAWQPLPEVYSE